MSMLPTSLDASAESSSDPNSPGRVLVLLCTYNEFGNLPKVVEQISSQLQHADILVVDDNSPDGTGTWAEESKSTQPNLYTVRRAGKLGLGSATREGIVWALARQYDYLINFDADLSHNPADALRLLNACRDVSSMADVVIGSRYVAGGRTVGLSWMRSCASKLFNYYAINMLGLPIRDCSGSFRCYRTSKLRELNIAKLTCNGYGFLEEILFHLNRGGARFAELPITYEHRLSGASKLSARDALGAILVIHRLAFGWRS